MKFIATAEHSSGQSVSHPCREGLYSDPADDFQMGVEGTLEEAIRLAESRLEEMAETWPTCDCPRKESPGGNAWLNSVSVQLWPQDRAALDAILEENPDFDPQHDPFHLIPDSLKTSL